VTGQRASAREIGLAAALLLLVGVVVYGPYVVDGGFTIDDWSHAAGAAYLGDDLLSHYWAATSNRPVLVGYVPLTHLVFGPNPWLHNAWSIVLAVAMATALYAVLRRVAIRPVHAGAIALLVLLFPWSDAARFWATASHINLSIAMGLAGILLALRGLDARAAGRGGWALHAAALVLYALSVLTYEIAGLVLLFAGALYLTRLEWPVVRLRWAADIAVIVPCLAWNALRADRVGSSVAEMRDHADAIADGGATVLALAAMPFGSVGRQAILTGLVAVVVAAAVVRALMPAHDEARPVLGRWLTIVAAGLLVEVAGWILYVPADAYYNPASAGAGNRVNVMAAIGIVIAVYGAFVLLSTLLWRGLPHWRRLAVATSAALAIVIALGYADDVRKDRQVWVRASASADRALAAIEKALPDPPAGSTIYTFGYPGGEAPGITIFGYTWDLVGAIRLTYDDPSLAGYPMLGATQIDCGRDGLAPIGPGWTGAQLARYGSAYFVDVPSGRTKRIDSRRECLAARPYFVPGPPVRP